MATDKAYATKLLDRLSELDYQTVEAYYDMGSIISSMQHGKLYELLDYNSMHELIENELTYTPSTGYRYATMYRDFRRLHYLKHEAVTLLKKFGLTHMCNVIRPLNTKIGSRAIKNRIAALEEHQINFQLTTAQLAATDKALLTLGAEKSDCGRWKNSSEAFMAMVEQVNYSAKNNIKLVAVK